MANDAVLQLEKCASSKEMFRLVIGLLVMCENLQVLQ